MAQMMASVFPNAANGDPVAHGRGQAGFKMRG